MSAARSGPEPGVVPVDVPDGSTVPTAPATVGTTDPASVRSWLEHAAEARRDGRLAAAVDWSDRAMRAVLDPAADRELRAEAAQLRAMCLFQFGALHALVHESATVLPILRSDGPAASLVRVMRAVCLAASETGQFGLALSLAQECQQLAMGTGDRGLQSLALNALACTFERLGDPWQGERLMAEALSLAREHGQRAEILIALSNFTALRIGRYYLLRDARGADEAREPLVPALETAQEALVLAREQGDPFPQVLIEGNLGEVLLQLGRVLEAGPYLQSSLAAAQHHGYVSQAWRVNCTLAEMELQQGQAREAWDRLQATLAQAEQADQRITRLRLHHALARTAEALGRHREALHHLQAYLQLERSRAVSQLQAQSELFITRLEAEQVRLEAQRQRLRAAELEADVRRDPLTGVGNRREIEQRLPGLLREAAAGDLPLTLVMVDVDRFKPINDQFGHSVGDQVLERLGQLLRDATRGPDLICRVGGDEFLLVLPHTALEPAREVCERLRRMVAQYPWHALAPGLRVTLSLGLAGTPPHDEASLKARADRALYRAKAEGRDRLAWG